MKKIGLCLFLITSINAWALPSQKSSAELNENGGHESWYLSPELRHTWLYGSDTMMPAIRGAWIFDRDWAVGASVAVATNSILYSSNDARSSYRMLNLGGYLEYAALRDQTFHPAASLTIGGGATQKSNFLSLEPRLDGILNLSTAVRVGWGISYRFTRTLQSNVFSSERIGGLTSQLFLQLVNL